MGFLRNKEIKWLFTFMASFSLVAVFLAIQFSIASAVLVGAACFGISAITTIYTRRRYRAIADLADYLCKVNNGEYLIEIQNYHEGELSILESEIYKVTVSLREQSQAANEEKLRLKDVLSDISHQLKTPLTSMGIMVDLLLDSPPNEKKRREFTMGLRGQLERLTWLSGTLLKLSQLDAGSVVFKPGYVGLKELIDGASSPMLISMELKQQSLKTVIDGSIFCDPSWTTEALTNLLKNCVEHTPIGGEIYILATENSLFSEVRISDNGPGIDSVDLPHIFQRFYKGENASSGSSGIGLAMAKTILEAQGGTLEAGNGGPESCGAVFSAKLPKPSSNA